MKTLLRRPQGVRPECLEQAARTIDSYQAHRKGGGIRGRQSAWHGESARLHRPQDARPAVGSGDLARPEPEHAPGCDRALAQRGVELVLDPRPDLVSIRQLDLERELGRRVLDLAKSGNLRFQDEVLVVVLLLALVPHVQHPVVLVIGGARTEPVALEFLLLVQPRAVRWVVPADRVLVPDHDEFDQSGRLRVDDVLDRDRILGVFRHALQRQGGPSNDAVVRLEVEVPRLGEEPFEVDHLLGRG